MEKPRTAWLTADFFTQSHRISGRVDVRRRALPDILNDQTTSFVQLEDAYISPINHPGNITATYPASSLTKSNLTLAVVPHQDDALSRKYAYGSYWGAFVHKVFITTAAFEVVGHLRLSSKIDLRGVLTSGTDDFIAILDGRVQVSMRPDITFDGGGILVNKRHIGAFSMVSEEEPREEVGDGTSPGD
ncbi:MAG: hypothetical protein PVH62_10475 [Anaerolineae bacterium]|jgi:hypothetical protein